MFLLFENFFRNLFVIFFLFFFFFLPIIHNYILLCRKLIIEYEYRRLQFLSFFSFLDNNSSSYFSIFAVFVYLYLFILFLKVLYYIYSYIGLLFKKYYFMENQEFILYQIWHRYFSFKDKEELKKKYSFTYLKDSEISTILDLRKEDNIILNQISNNILDDNVIYLTDQHNNFKDLKLKDLSKDVTLRNLQKYSLNNNFLKMYKIKKTSLILNEFWLKDVYFHYLEKHKQILFNELYVKVRKDIYIKRYGPIVVNNIIDKKDDKNATKVRIKTDLQKISSFKKI